MDLIPEDGLRQRDRERHAVVSDEARVDDLRRRRRVKAAAARESVMGLEEDAGDRTCQGAREQSAQAEASIATSRSGAPPGTRKPRDTDVAGSLVPAPT